MKRISTNNNNVVDLPSRLNRRAAAELWRSPFHQILGDAAWSQLPDAVRRRFSTQVAPAETRVFTGEVVETKMNVAGYVLSQAARLVGAPLPLTTGATGPANVTVCEDEKLGAQIWTRIYARPGRFPQVISSAKRLSGPTGLEECLGAGLLMRLQLIVEDGALIFRSTSYAIELLQRTWTLPAWATPGQCDVIHRDVGGGQFTFTLQLKHPIFGVMMRQVGLFREV